MTKPIDGSSSAVIVPDHDEAAPPPPPPAPAKTASRESNQVDAWSSPAADAAVADIESAYGFGISPDMETVNSDFSKLDGLALLKTLNGLDRDEKLESVLNEMTPDDRQRLVNQAVKGNLLKRENGNGELKAKYELPASFQKMVDELNVLQSHKKPAQEFTYNWSSYREDFHDVAKRKFADQVSTLKPGDSIELDAKIGASAEVATFEAEAKVGVKRSSNGDFVVSASLEAEAGVHLDGGWIKGEGLLGAGSRVEYRFANASDAKAAAELFATNPPEAVEKYGRPAAIEFEGKAASELTVGLGVDFVKLAKLKNVSEAKMKVRVELEGDHPSLAVSAELKTSAKAAMKAGVKQFNVEARGADAHLAGNVEIELKSPISDRDAFLRSPITYAQQNREKLTANAEAKVKMQWEAAAGHHSSELELELKTSASDLQRVAGQVVGTADWKRMVAGLGEGVSVKLEEKGYELKHVGLDIKAEVGHAGFEIGAGYERKSLEKTRVLYEGTATRFISGQPE